MTHIETVNPYWDEVKNNVRACNDADHYAWYMQHLEKRSTCCRKYAWAIPDPASVAFVASYLAPRAIEIGAGTGYWAWQLAQYGIDILAYDEAPPDKVPNFYFSPPSEETPQTLVKTWHPVEHGSPELLPLYTDRTLFLCWPPYADPMAHRCLQKYQGSRLVFIGEDEGGCTGTNDFFELLAQDWRSIAKHPIAQWDGMHDTITVYERKDPDGTLAEGQRVPSLSCV